MSLIASELPLTADRKTSGHEIRGLRVRVRGARRAILIGLLAAADLVRFAPLFAAAKDTAGLGAVR